MENVPVAVESNVVSLETKKSCIPTLTELGKIDPEVRDMVKLIHRFNLREKAVALFSKKLSKRKPARPTFLR